jgi:hypothetical protein
MVNPNPIVIERHDTSAIEAHFEELSRRASARTGWFRAATWWSYARSISLLTVAFGIATALVLLALAPLLKEPAPVRLSAPSAQSIAPRAATDAVFGFTKFRHRASAVPGVDEVVIGRGFVSSLDPEPSAQWCYATVGRGPIVTRLDLAYWVEGEVLPMELPEVELDALGFEALQLMQLRGLCDFRLESSDGTAPPWSHGLM